MPNAVRIWALAAVVVLTVEATAARPIGKIDRAKVVGAPVLDEKTAPGVYVWLEDGWFNVAAVAKKRQRIAVRVSSSKKIEEVAGELSVDRDGGSVVLTAMVGLVPVKGKFKTDGEVTISAEGPLFIGPLSKPGAKTVKIGRY